MTFSLDDGLAAPLGELQAAAQTLTEEVRSRFVDPKCRLFWRESTLGRMYSLAALSHECIYLDHLSELAGRDTTPTEVLALLTRHHLETWITGLYLFEGGEEALETFLGNDARAQEALKHDIGEAQSGGSLLDIDVTRFSDDNEWDPASFRYAQVFRDVDRIGRDLGLIFNVRAVYVIAYRSMSNNLGAHPTVRVLDRYIDTGRTFALVEDRPKAIGFRRRALQWAVILTCIHAAIVLGGMGLPSETYAEFLEKFKLPRVPGSNDSNSAE
jgi:hypothetical protein